MTFTRISADCHIDMPWMPANLFTENASAALRDRMPYVTDGPDGPTWTSKNSASFGLWGGRGPSGQQYLPAVPHRPDLMASTRLPQRGQNGIARPPTPRLPLH